MTPCFAGTPEITSNITKAKIYLSEPATGLNDHRKYGGELNDKPITIRGLEIIHRPVIYLIYFCLGVT
jgi:hypothetical protein